MSHELTVFEWVNRLTNEFNELRIAASDVVKMKAVEFFSDASVFIANHPTELLSGVLSMFTVVLFAIVLNRALNAENKVHELTGLLADSNDSYLTTEKLRNFWEDAWTNLDSENDKLINEINERAVKIEDSQLAFEAMREEFSDKLEDVRNQRDEIQGELDDARIDYDNMVDERDEWMADANLYELERDEAQEQLEAYKAAVPQLAYVA